MSTATERPAAEMQSEIADLRQQLATQTRDAFRHQHHTNLLRAELSRLRAGQQVKA